MRGAVFLDYRDVRAAAFGDLINVGTFDQAGADIGMTKAVSRSRLSLALKFQFLFFETPSRNDMQG
jgi:hypothetical protein